MDSIKFICSLSNKWSACTKLINPETKRFICITKLQLVSDFDEQQSELKEHRELRARGKFKGKLLVASEFCACISPPLFYRSPKLVDELINIILNAAESCREERRDIVCGENHSHDGQTTGSQGNKSGEFLKQAPGTNHLNSKFNRQIAEAVNELRSLIKSYLISRC